MGLDPQGAGVIVVKADPRKAGFEPDNGDSTEEERAALKARMNGPRVWTMKEVLKDRNFWLVMIGYGLLFAAGWIKRSAPAAPAC